MSRHRVDDAGEVWWVGYDRAAATYFADRDVDLDNDDYDAPHLPTFADLERAVNGRLALPPALRAELAAEDPRSTAATEAEVTARTNQVTAAVRDESQTTTDIQREVTRVALDALDGTGFALAGSSAIREHGVTDRPTEDVDLFTSNVNIENFGRSVDQVLEQLRSTGYVVDEGRRTDQFARLHVQTMDGVQVDIDMGMDWRQADPVTLSVGPVLSLEDAIGNKVSALYSRGEARDFLDVDAIRSSGHFTDQQLVDAARERDPGFEVPIFAAQLERARTITPDRVSEYGVDADELAAIQQRFAQWASQLTADVARDKAAENVRRFANLDAPLRLNEVGKPARLPHGSYTTPPSGRPHGELGR